MPKTCKDCGQVEEGEDFHRDSRSPDGRRHVCKDCAKARTASYRVANAERVTTYARAYVREPAVMERHNAAGRTRHEVDREAVFRHYGERCSACGSAEDLQISYLNGDGRERRDNDYEARTIYRWLRKHGYPDGFQTLCRGCNLAKARARQHPVL